MSEKKHLSLLKILAMSVGFFGIQHGFAIQFARMSSIYEKLGAKPDEIPFLWLAAPMTGFIIQPIIGYMSDRTWGRLGRRRPYFLFGAILASIALFIMPYSTSVLMAASLLWALDASINISMEPFRAFVADKLPTKQIATGYAMQTLMIGLGGFLGSWIASYDWLAVYPGLSKIAPSSMHIQFFICAIIYICSVVFTVATSPEEPPADLAAFNKKKQENKGIGNWWKETSDAIFNMPSSMKRLAAVQFFTWMGLFCMWMFYSIAVAHHVFGAADPASPEYDAGINFAGRTWMIYNIVSTIFALVIPQLALKFGRVGVHTFGLTAAGVGLLSVIVIKDPFFLFISMAGVGIGWATILSMPYAIIVDHIPKEKYGIYMGIFNMFIVIPEIIASLVFGKVMQHLFNNNRVLAVAMGGAFMLIAAIIVQSLRKFEKKA